MSDQVQHGDTEEIAPDLANTTAVEEQAGRQLDDAAVLETKKTAIGLVLSRQTEGVFEIGQLLKEAKAAVPHGKFLDWVANELPFAARTAQLYMRIHEKLSSCRDVLGPFQLNTLDALSAKAVSDKHRRRIASEIKAGKIVSDEALLKRLVDLVDPDRAARLAEQVKKLEEDAVRLAQEKESQSVARKKAAQLTREIAGDRITEFIELMRAAGLSEFADTLEELVTEPDAPVLETDGEPQEASVERTSEVTDAIAAEADAVSKDDGTPAARRLFNRSPWPGR